MFLPALLISLNLDHFSITFIINTLPSSDAQNCQCLFLCLVVELLLQKKKKKKYVGSLAAVLHQEGSRDAPRCRTPLTCLTLA